MKKNSFNRVMLSCVIAGMAITVINNTHAAKPAPPGQPAAIVYRSSEGICGMAADGSSKRILLANSGRVTFDGPSISPDGRKLAVIRGSGSGPNAILELCLANLDGTGLTLLHTFTPAEPKFTYQAFVVWSPDGSKLLYSSEFAGGGLYYVDRANPQFVQAITTGLGSWGPIALSADLDPGTEGDQCKVAIGSTPVGGSTSITILDLVFDTAGTISLGSTLLRIPPQGMLYTLSWSPTGEFLAYNHDDWNQNTADLRLIRLVYEGLNIVDWTYTSVAIDMANNSRMTWSPDGQFIAFTKMDWDIYRGTVKFDANGQPFLDPIINLTKTPISAYSKGTETHPEWSPTWMAAP